jgi:putative hydrolase of the HAD superfamily
MKLQAEAYDQIILDLGGVILDIDYGASVRAFQSLGFEDFDNQYSQARQSGIFDDLECGRIEPAEFRQWIRSRISVSEEAIDKAWNSMLLGRTPIQ